MDPLLKKYLMDAAAGAGVPTAPGEPPSWLSGDSVGGQYAPQPSAPPFDLMAYFKAMRPELYSQQSMDDALAKDQETNRNRDIGRSFAQAAGYFTGRGPDYTGLEPTSDAVKALGMRQDQAMKSAEVGSRVAQFATSMSAQDPTSAASLFAYKAAMADPYIGPKLAAMGGPGRVSKAQIDQIIATAKTGGELGKDQATITKDIAAGNASQASADDSNALRTGKVTAQQLGNDKTTAEIPGVRATTAKTQAETEKIRAETGAIGADKDKKSADDLRSQWLAQPDYKNAQTVADSYAKIKTAPASGAGDVALLYGYMKILDPGSAVREGEIALGKDTGSVPEAIRIFYNKAVAGEQFTPEMRQRFRESARLAYNAQVARYQQTASEFARLATQRGVSPRDVVLDVGLVPDNGGGGSAPGSGLTTLQPK